MRKPAQEFEMLARDMLSTALQPWLAATAEAISPGSGVKLDEEEAALVWRLAIFLEDRVNT
jgi:hypothetical protein